MAKLALVLRQQKRVKTVAKFKVRRAQLLEVIQDSRATEEAKEAARAKLQKLFDITSSPEGLAVELAVRDWSRRDSDVALRLRRADNRRMEFVRSLFGQFCADDIDVEVRSMMSYSMVIGSYFVAVEHGDKTRPQVLQLAIDHLLR